MSLTRFKQVNDGPRLAFMFFSFYVSFDDNLLPVTSCQKSRPSAYCDLHVIAPRPNVYISFQSRLSAMLSDSEQHQLPQLRISDGPNFDHLFQIPENNQFLQTSVDDLVIPSSLHPIPSHSLETHRAPSVEGYVSIKQRKTEYYIFLTLFFLRSLPRSTFSSMQENESAQSKQQT